MDTNELGRIIRERRKTMKLTLRRLAAMSGVNSSYIGRIETGERFPSAHVLRKLAKPLGFGEMELLKLAGFMSQDEIDDRIDRLKEELKREIADTLVRLHNKIDSL